MLIRRKEKTSPSFVMHRMQDGITAILRTVRKDLCQRHTFSGPISSQQGLQRLLRLWPRPRRLPLHPGLLWPSIRTKLPTQMSSVLRYATYTWLCMPCFACIWDIQSCILPAIFLKVLLASFLYNLLRVLVHCLVTSFILHCVEFCMSLRLATIFSMCVMDQTLAGFKAYLLRTVSKVWYQKRILTGTNQLLQVFRPDQPLCFRALSVLQQPNFHTKQMRRMSCCSMCVLPAHFPQRACIIASLHYCTL